MASNTSVEDIREEDYEAIRIHQIPVEILLMIFDGLSLEGILQVERVCKRWRNIISASLSLWENQMKAMKQNEGHAVKRKFDQLISTSSKDALMVRKAVEEVHQKMKKLRANFQESKRRKVEISFSDHKVDIMNVDFQNGIIATFEWEVYACFKFYHLYDLTVAGSLLIPQMLDQIIMPDDLMKNSDFQIQGELIVVMQPAQESPKAVGEIWNWKEKVKSCVLTRKLDETLDELCLFKDDFIVAKAGNFLVVWKYDAASGDGKEKILMPLWDICLFHGIDITGIQITYGNNKVFYHCDKKLRFLCLLTGIINDVDLSRKLSIAGGRFFLSYPHILMLPYSFLNSPVLGLLTESPMKSYFATNSLSLSRSQSNGYICEPTRITCYNPRIQESRRCYGVKHNFSGNLFLVAQKSEGDIKINDLYATLDLRLGFESRLVGMDDYFLILLTAVRGELNLVLFDFFDV